MNERARKRRRAAAAALLAATMLVGGCSVTLTRSEAPAPRLEPEAEFEISNEVEHIYVTIAKQDPSEGERFRFTFGEMNEMGRTAKVASDPALRILFQEGTAEGPLPDGAADEVNATLELRGLTALSQPQKSYKIKIDEGAQPCDGQYTLNLNKHFRDLTRVRNKFIYDYFTYIPDVMSLRTSFVNLHVKDLSGGATDADFVDYGLYTHVEQANAEFLAWHGLDPYGQLYKAVGFGFFRYEDKLKLVMDPTYDEAAFETVLEIKGSHDHQKLIAMLNDVNDRSLNFDAAFARHFDRDNYLTWMAVNILFGNYDTTALNFYLYSPSNSSKWYFVPWDYDGTLGNFERFGGNETPRAPWVHGISNWWSVLLHQRAMQSPELMKGLFEKIEALSAIVTEERSEALLDGYYDIVSSYVKEGADLELYPKDLSMFEAEYERLATMPDFYKEQFYANAEKPMPIFLGTPELRDGKLRFVWDPSYDLQGDPLSYDFAIGSTPDLAEPLAFANDLASPEYAIDPLPAGTYYWRAIVKDAKGNTQVAYGESRGEAGERFYGVNRYVAE